MNLLLDYGSLQTNSQWFMKGRMNEWRGDDSVLIGSLLTASFVEDDILFLSSPSSCSLLLSLSSCHSGSPSLCDWPAARHSRLARALPYPSHLSFFSMKPLQRGRLQHPLPLFLCDIWTCEMSSNFQQLFNTLKLLSARCLCKNPPVLLLNVTYGCSTQSKVKALEDPSFLLLNTMGQHLCHCRNWQKKVLLT